MKLLLFLLFLVSCSLENVNKEVIVQEAKLNDQILVEGGSLPILDITNLSVAFKSLNSVTYQCFYDRMVDEKVERNLECNEIDGVEFNEELGVLTWNAPIEIGHSDETYEVLIIATDGQTESSDIFEVTIYDTNNPPKLAIPDSKVYYEGSGDYIDAITYDINTSDNFDIDHDRIVYSCQYFEDEILTDCSEIGVDFNSITSYFDWTPPYREGHSNKTYTFVISGSDGELSNTVTFDILVLDQHSSPFISTTENQVVFEGESISEIDFNDITTETDYDLDNDLLSYTCFYDTNPGDGVTDTNPCSEIYVNFNSRTGTFNWIPPYFLVDSGHQIYEFKVSVTDNNTTSSRIFTIKVFNKIKSSYVDICAGDFHTCAIKSDGMIYCWGDNSDYQLASNANSYSIPSKVNVDNFLDTDSSLSFKKISCGAYHNCALSNKNDIYCWGYNYHGQLGNNSTESSNSLVKVDDSNLSINESFIDISAGYYHNCSLTNMGKVYCWGYNSNAQLGINSSENKSIPHLATEGFENKFFKKIASGYYHNCAINDDGVVYCWGYNNQSQSGSMNGLPLNVSLNKLDVNTPYIDLSLGGAFSCAIRRTGDVECWGSNIEGALGVNSNDDSLPLNHLPKLWVASNLNNTKALSMTSYNEHSCAITDIGKVFCWGSNDYGQQGNNSTVSNILPTAIDSSNSGNFKKVAAGYDHTCGINLNGEIYCWGKNDKGQLGDGTTTNSLVPVKVDDSLYPVEEKKFSKVLVGDDFGCALSTRGLLYCWGDNDNFQLATEANSNSYNPRLIVDRDNEPIYFKDFALGSDHVCALKFDSTLLCWGQNNKEQLSADSIDKSSDPREVVLNVNSKEFLKVYAGNDVSCALITENQVYCWGSNQFGKLGNYDLNTPTSKLPIEAIYSDYLGYVIKMKVGKNNLCALRSTGELYCWGSNAHGQIGVPKDSNNDGEDDQLEFNEPQLMDMSSFGSDNKFVDVMIGDNHICGVSVGGKVYCAGDNSSYQIGKSFGSEFDEVVLASWFDEYSFYKLFSANNKTFGISGNGDLYIWGDGDYHPRKFDTGYRYNSTFKEISNGTNHSCALSYSGDVYCWGENTKGQLGVENYTSSQYPLKVEF